jgi:hypothetical protein
MLPQPGQRSTSMVIPRSPGGCPGLDSTRLGEGPVECSTVHVIPPGLVVLTLTAENVPTREGSLTNDRSVGRNGTPCHPKARPDLVVGHAGSVGARLNRRRRRSRQAFRLPTSPPISPTGGIVARMVRLLHLPTHLVTGEWISVRQPPKSRARVVLRFDLSLAGTVPVSGPLSAASAELCSGPDPFSPGQRHHRRRILLIDLASCSILPPRSSRAETMAASWAGSTGCWL